MSTVDVHTHFLVWPRSNPDWERDLKLLQPAADELWNRMSAAVPESATKISRAFTVTGLLSGVGTTTTAASLAFYAAQELGQRVLLVEADLRAPRLNELGLAPRCPGFGGVLQQRTSIKHVIFELPSYGIHVLPAGKAVASPSTQMNVAELQSFLASVEPFFDTVIFDAPPITTSPEVRYLVAVADATVPVIRGGTSLPEQAAYWIAKIREYHGHVGAVCMSGVKSPLPTRIRSLL